MVNADFLGKMKPDSVLINTSRGDVVDEEAILAKLESCKDFWYGTDVYCGEPSAKACDFTHPIAQHPRVYGTHHCGASTQQAEAAIGAEAVRVIKQYVTAGEIDKANWVNRAATANTLHRVQIRHLDKVGVLSHVFTAFSEAGWNL